jgi:peptidoglycan/xylan/chitin deacetylase (PgdA/CDA1 family)
VNLIVIPRDKVEMPRMKAITLTYHDIIAGDRFDSSGFPGVLAARYKVKVDQFREHLQSIRKVITSGPVKVYDLLQRGAKVASPFILTFDDGGTSGFPLITDILESLGWHGHFFISTAYVNVEGFLSREQIVSIRSKGHVIGTHSHSHPERMSRCGVEELIKEWSTSKRILSDILSEEVEVASVPGGYYGHGVAEAASAVGIKVLFTSEPRVSCKRVNGCYVFGRFTIFGNTSVQTTAGLAGGYLVPRLKQLLLWNIKKVAR